MAIKIALLIGFFAIMVCVGIYARNKAASVDGFVLAARNMGPWMTAFAYGTTYFSAVIFVGYAGQFGFKYGLSSVWIGIGNALIGSLLAWLVLARRTRSMTHSLGSRTMPEFFGSRYDSQALKVAASAIIFVFLVPYTASVYKGLSVLFEMAFGVPYYWCVIAMAIFTCAYVVLGGYLATVINDFIQGIVMLFGIVLVVWSVLDQQGGLVSAIGRLSLFDSDLAPTLGQSGAFASILGPDPLNLLGVVVLTSLGAWGMPQMVHKFYTIRNEQMIRTGTIVSTFFAVVVAGGSYFMGSFARLYDSPALYDAAGRVAYDSIVPHMLSGLSNLVVGLIIMLVLSASMSTLASLVLTSSSSLTLDFIRGTLVKELSERAQLRWLRGLIVVFILVSVYIALNPPTFIAQLMGISWGALAGSFLAPLIYGLYWKRTSRAAIWACFIMAVGITVSNLFLHYIASPINAGAITMVLGLILVPLVSLLAPDRDKSRVAQVFACYDK
ncbi:MAG: sodium:solute symporter [Clostridia bacterium]|nr:sodium:solute symporter [Clostridia bacterium]